MAKYTRQLKSIIDLRGTAIFLIVAILIAFGISRWLHINFWFAVAISVVALLVVGLTTLADNAD
jgi:hypothetical protein